MAQDSFDAIVNAVMLAESGGRRFDKQGNLLTSSKGAKGEMQVLDKTKYDPGFGVEPARANTPDERARVGRDYLRAMVDRYGELDKALAAYNWGPGNTDKWIAAGADPKKLPSETRSYIDKIKSTLGGERVAAESGPKPEAAPVPAAAAGAPQRAPVKAAPVARTADLGMSYQAALALSFLADEAEREEGRREYDEREPSTAQKWLASATPKVSPEMLAMPYSSPFGPELEPVRAAQGGFIAVGYDTPSAYKDGGSVSDGEWKDGPPPPEVPRGLSGDIFGAATMEDAPRGPRTARERLREMYHSARDFVEDVPRTPLGMATEGAMFLADRYKLLPPAMQELMAQERMARMERRAERRARGFDEGGEVAAQEIVADRGPSVNEGTAQSRLRDFKKLDEETQQAIIQADPRRVTALYPAPASVSLPYTLSTIPGARAMYDKSLQDLNSGIRGYAVSALRSEKGVPTQDVVFLKPGRPAMDELHTRAHEAEHVLAKRGLGDARSINDKFDELMGDSKARRRFVSEALGLQDYLRNTYGITSSYFNPKQREFQGSLLPNLLFEQLAELAAVEQARNTDLTKDPTLRNTIFKDKKVREVYNAITGLRQTRLDARDLAPYTPIAEKPEGVMGFIRDKLGFKDGGEVSGDEPTAEELERASKAAFGIVPSSGKGRKAGRVTETLQSGQAQLEALKGATLLPQNLVGALSDVGAMALRPLGYSVEKPMFGSDWLKEKSRQAGVAFPEPTDPTLRAFYTAGDIGSNLVNPAGATRTAVRGVEKTGQAAKMLAEMATRPVERDPFLSGRMGSQRGAVRPPGGSFVQEGFVSADPKTGHPVVKYGDPVAAAVKDNLSNSRDPVLNQWFDQKITAYLRRDMGSENDPFVKATDEGRKTHIFPEGQSTARRDLLKVPPSHIEFLRDEREAAGFPAVGFAKTPAGRAMEARSDLGIYSTEIRDLLPFQIPPGQRKLAETDPTMRLYSLYDFPFKNEGMGLELLRNKMLEMRSSGPEYSAYNQPGKKIPEQYRLTDAALEGLSPVQASERVALFDAWKQETRQRMASKALFEDPSLDKKVLDGGYVMINAPDLEAYPRMREIVQDVGCDGNWCTREEHHALNYGSGENRLSILFDSKARPKAQITVTRLEPKVSDFLRYEGEPAAVQGMDPWSWQYEDAVFSSPEFQQWARSQPPNVKISEIKGFNNETQLQKEPYVGKVQQFVQDLDRQYGLEGRVDNLDGIGLTSIMALVPNHMWPYAGPIRQEVRRLNGGTIFTAEDPSKIESLIQQAYRNVTQSKE